MQLDTFLFFCGSLLQLSSRYAKRLKRANPPPPLGPPQPNPTLTTWVKNSPHFPLAKLCFRTKPLSTKKKNSDVHTNNNVVEHVECTTSLFFFFFAGDDHMAACSNLDRRGFLPRSSYFLMFHQRVSVLRLGQVSSSTGVLFLRLLHNIS